MESIDSVFFFDTTAAALIFKFTNGESPVSRSLQHSDLLFVAATHAGLFYLA